MAIYNLTSASWTQISDGTQSVIVNALHLNDFSIAYYIGPTAPAVDDFSASITFTRADNMRTLPAGAAIWAIARSPLSSVTLFVAAGAQTISGAVSVAALAASGKTAIIGSFSAVGNSAAFTPISGRSFNMTLTNTWAGSVRVTRSFDSGATWSPVTANGTTILTFTANASEQWSDDEVGVQYRLECTSYTSGTVTYRISQ